VRLHTKDNNIEVNRRFWSSDALTCNKLSWAACHLMRLVRDSGTNCHFQRIDCRFYWARVAFKTTFICL